MHFELSIINGKAVFDIVRAHRSECIRIVREAYLAHADGQSVNPDSYFLKFPDKPDCRIIALPAYLGNNFGVAGLKWIASYPANIQRGFPRASAVLVLNNYETGYPLCHTRGLDHLGRANSRLSRSCRALVERAIAPRAFARNRGHRVHRPVRFTSSSSTRDGRSRKYGYTTGRLLRVRNSETQRAALSSTARSRLFPTSHKL